MFSAGNGACNFFMRMLKCRLPLYFLKTKRKIYVRPITNGRAKAVMRVATASSVGVSGAEKIKEKIAELEDRLYEIRIKIAEVTDELRINLERYRAAGNESERKELQGTREKLFKTSQDLKRDEERVEAELKRLKH